jgi:hypothetical protein
MFVRDNTQAYGLKKLMISKGILEPYELALPLIKVKLSTIKNLNIGTLLPLKLKKLKPILIDKDNYVYKIKLYDESIKVIKKKKKLLRHLRTKKYEILKCTFITLQIDEIKEGKNIKIESSDFDVLTLSLDGNEIGKGVFAKSDDTVGIKITRLYK